MLWPSTAAGSGSGVGTGALWDQCPFPYRALSYITMASKQGLGRAYLRVCSPCPLGPLSSSSVTTLIHYYSQPLAGISFSFFKDKCKPQVGVLLHTHLCPGT